MNFITVIYYDTVRIFLKSIEISKIHYSLLYEIYNTVYFLVYLVVSVVFFHLADFKFEERASYVP